MPRGPAPLPGAAAASAKSTSANASTPSSNSSTLSEDSTRAPGELGLALPAGGRVVAFKFGSSAELAQRY